MSREQEPKPPPVYPRGWMHRGLRLLGAIFLVFVIGVAVIESSKSAEQRRAERNEILLKLDCRDLRMGTEPSYRSLSRREIEAECRRSGLL